MKKMTIYTIMLTAAICVTGFAHAQKQSAEEILKDPQKRNEIIKAITSDRQMMMEMMDQVMENDEASQMLTSNRQMMKQMVSSDNMTEMMEKDQELAEAVVGQTMEWAAQDSTNCMMMGNMMMKNQHMRATIMDMCQKEGMKMGEGMMEHKQQHKQMHEGMY